MLSSKLIMNMLSRIHSYSSSFTGGVLSRNTRSLTSSGFTIVELLIVIIVIAILAALVISGYSGVQTRAKATAIVDLFTKTEKAFHMFAVEEGRTTWWLDTELTGASNPNVQTVINNTNLKNYLQTIPDVQSFNATTFKYDNDGDTYNGCGANTAGVNIYLREYAGGTALAQEVDNIMDDGNLSCGKVTLSNSSPIVLRYSIGRGQNIGNTQ